MKTPYNAVLPLGESGQEPIIFLHGMFVSKKHWERVAPIICRETKRKGYLLDARNHGEGPWTDEMTYDNLTADVLEFMDDHDIRKAIVVGHSMGGRTAINLALKHPHRVEALVVEDMTPRNVESGSKSITRSVFDSCMEYLSHFPVNEDLNEIKRQIMEFLISIFHPTLLDKHRVYNNIDVDCVPVKKEGNKLTSEFNADAVLAMLKSNALVQDLPLKNLVYNGDAMFIYGSKGFFNLHRDRTIKVLFPRAVIKRVEGASHLVHLDSPEEYSKIVSNFLLQRDMQLSKY